ncbi:MAG: hypothetical protein MK135_04665 [Polyangiaceae bacterium]|nr:hypothetical protein [Polyangiaceae bacterium]
MKKLNRQLISSFSLCLLAMASTACSDDTDEGGGTGGMGGGSPVGGCPEHELITETSSGACEIAGGTTTEDMHLVAGSEYFLGGKLFIGDDSSSTELKVDPGVTVLGGDKTFIVIQRGATIMAEGTAEEPIIFTSAQAERAPGDWGGLVINGKATTNYGTTDVEGEAGTGKYGGEDDTDNSGSLKYVRVEFGGNQVDNENELNGIAFQGVGSGTTVDYVQVHSSKDDGIEFFGGTVEVSHVMITNIGDDSIDWTGGWRGKATYVGVQQWAGNGDRGIEADNNGDNNTAEPYSNPTLSNITIWGAGDSNAESTGALFREGTKGTFSKIAIGNFADGCLSLDQDQTLANAEDDSLSIANSVISCASKQYKEKYDAPNDGAVETWFTGGTDNVATTDALDLTSGDESAPDLSPKAGSPLLAGDDYVGAFAEGENWAAGWTSYDAK